MGESLPQEAANRLKSILDLVKRSPEEDDTWEAVQRTLSSFGHINNFVNERAGRNYALLHFAASWGKEAVCRSLVETHGADASLTTGKGETPGDLALRRGHGALGELLKKWESDPPKRKGRKEPPSSKVPSEMPPAKRRAVAPETGDDEPVPPPAPPSPIVELVELLDKVKGPEGEGDTAWADVYRLLSEHSGDFKNLVNDRVGRNYALLHCAASVGNATACRELVRDAGADPILRTGRGETPSQLARRRGHEALADELQEQEADIEDGLKGLLGNVRDEGSQDENWEDVYQFLKANKNVVNNTGGGNYGFLHHAASWGNTKACRTLIKEFGADPFLRTHKKRELPEDIAKKCEHTYTQGVLHAFAQGPARNYVG